MAGVTGMWYHMKYAIVYSHVINTHELIGWIQELFTLQIYLVSSCLHVAQWRESQSLTNNVMMSHDGLV